MNAFLRGERYVYSNAVRRWLRREALTLRHSSYCRIFLACLRRSDLSLKGVVHTRMLGVRPGSVGQTNGTYEKRDY